MEKIYILTTDVMNGTVVSSSYTSAFATKELAEKTMDKLKDANKECDCKLRYTITESSFFKEEKDVPVLNEEKSS